SRTRRPSGPRSSRARGAPPSGSRSPGTASARSGAAAYRVRCERASSGGSWFAPQAHVLPRASGEDGAEVFGMDVAAAEPVDVAPYVARQVDALGEERRPSAGRVGAVEDGNVGDAAKRLSDGLVREGAERADPQHPDALAPRA